MVVLREADFVVDSSTIGVDVTILVVVVSKLAFDDVISPTVALVVVDTTSTGVVVRTTFSVVVSTKTGTVVGTPSS